MAPHTLDLPAAAAPLTDATRQTLVKEIHDAPGMVVLAVTGGGMAAITDLLLVPGASRTVIEVTVPYAPSSLASLTKDDGAGAVSEATANAMAAACLERALRFRPAADVPVAGVACTAALVTDRDRRGEDRACIALAEPGAVVSADVALEKAFVADGERARTVQDRAVADQLLRVIAKAVGVETS